MSSRFSIIPAVYLVMRQDGKILLARRANTGYMNGYYSLVAGHLEGDEPLTVAMAREAKEEAGIDVRPEDLQLIHVMHTRSEIPGSTDDERVDFYFTASSYEGTPSIQEPDKCDDMSWFPLDELPSNMVPRVSKALKHILKDSPYSDLGWSEA